MVELLRDVLPERVASTAGRDAPATPVVRIRPEQVADGPFVGCLLHPVELANLVQGVNAWRETAVEAEDLVFDDSCQGQVVKKLSELLPDVGVAILPQAFVIEPVDLGDLTRLVISSQDGDSVLIAHLERDKQSDRLDTVVAAIDIVAHKEVVRVGRLAANLKKFAQIMELAVNIAANSHRCAHLLHIRLVDEDFLGLVAENLDLTFRQRLAC